MWRNSYPAIQFFHFRLFNGRRNFKQNENMCVCLCYFSMKWLSMVFIFILRYVIIKCEWIKICFRFPFCYIYVFAVQDHVGGLLVWCLQHMQWCQTCTLCTASCSSQSLVFVVFKWKRERGLNRFRQLKKRSFLVVFRIQKYP